MKRIPYADHIVVLNEERRLTESGSFGDLAEQSGYISSFSLPAPNWDSTIEAEYVPKSKPSRTSVQPVKKEDWSEENVHKHRGSLGTYVFYIRAVGWIPTLIFLVTIAGFVFCISFPSKSLTLSTIALLIHGHRYLAEMVGCRRRSRTWRAHPALCWYLFRAGGAGHDLSACQLLGCDCKFGAKIRRKVPWGSFGYCFKVCCVFPEEKGCITDSVGSAPMRFLSTTDSGSILNRFSQDLQLIDMELPVAAINVVVSKYSLERALGRRIGLKGYPQRSSYASHR